MKVGRVTIGILGGMGPRATVQFEQLLLDCLPGTDQQLPTIITINDGSIPDRSDYLLDRGPSPIGRLQNNLKTLELAGATLIAIPCNTACAPAILGRLQPAADTRLVDLPAEVSRAIQQSQHRKIAILATEGTVRAGVYQAVCGRAGQSYIIPDEGLQLLVTKVIRAVKAGDMALARLFAVRVARQLPVLDCDAAILGCTELPLVQSFLVPPAITAIDTLAVLAKAVSRYTSKELQGEKV